MVSILKEKLSKLRPSGITLMWMGIYIIVSTLLAFSVIGVVPCLIYWAVFQLSLAACLLIYCAFVPKDRIPDWVVAQCWVVILCLALPINAVWYICHATELLFVLALSFAHLGVILWILPLYLGISFIVVTLFGSVYFIIFSDLPLRLPLNLSWLLSLLGLGILMFIIIIYDKIKIISCVDQNNYLMTQQKIKTGRLLQNITYDLMFNSVGRNSVVGDSAILEKVVEDVTGSISFLDESPLYKYDFQSIINKFSEWAVFLKKQAKSKEHMLLFPSEISLDELISKVEVSLKGEGWWEPRLFVQRQHSTVPEKIICDVDQTVSLLVTAILCIVDLNVLEEQYVKIHLHTTLLRYKKSDPTCDESFLSMVFPAIAIVISNSIADQSEFPKVQYYYEDLPEDSNSALFASLDLSAKRMERIIYAHYGYLALPSQNVMLLVLPCHVTNIRDEMITQLPMECLTSERPVSLEEERDSIAKLMKFHDYVCQMSRADPGVISEILLLIRRCHGFKRHPSGQLFYVRSVGIAEIVATWLFHAPKVIYTALLYDLVRYTRLPLSYIRANYDMGIFCFVELVLSVDNQKEDEASPLYVNNRFKEIIKQSKFSILYIKLAERLYDLRNASGYTNMNEVKYMAKETLAVDVELAKQYLEPEIADALANAATSALEICRESRGK